MSTSDTTAADLVTQLERQAEQLDTARERVEEFGESDLRTLADAYRSFTEMLDRYRDQVTGDDGDIQTIVEFQSRIDEVMRGIPEDVLLYETFEECDEYLQQKWFSDSDFEHVHDQLEPISDLVQRVDDLDDTRERYRQTRKDISYRCEELSAEIDDLERLASLADADLDAPTERIREPIEAYNEAVTEAFDEFRRSASARELVTFLERMEWYPLVAFESPPPEIVEYIEQYPPGTEPVPTLLEYASYSRSKLDHYVDDPDRLKHAIDYHRAYLDRLDAGPLRIDWPPPPAAELRWLCRELTSAVRRVASLPRETEYDRLRNSAVVAETLTESERHRLETGSVETELETARAEYDRLQMALAEFPERRR